MKFRLKFIKYFDFTIIINLGGININYIKLNSLITKTSSRKLKHINCILNLVIKVLIFLRLCFSEIHRCTKFICSLNYDVNN